MPTLSERANHILQAPLGGRSRLLLLVGTLLLVTALVFPLWNLTMFAPQYPGGLRLDIYSYRLTGGNNGQDVREINILNHYIGMHDLAESDFTEFKWMPFVLGGFGLLFLRSAVLGTVSGLVDLTVLYVYFAGFALWSFAYKLYSYGHNLAAGAPVKVPPFMPPVFGYKQLANFEVYSYPQIASYALGLVALVLLFALFMEWRTHGATDRAAPVS